MYLSVLERQIWDVDGHQICGEEACGVHDGTVYACDYCLKPVCLEHDDVLGNRDIDSGLILCQPCGDEYDKENHIAYTDRGDMMIVES